MAVKGDCLICGENCMADVRSCYPGCRYQDYNYALWSVASGDMRDDDPALGHGRTESHAYHDAASRLTKVLELRAQRKAEFGKGGGQSDRR
jgi:hypothetical protein